MTNENIQPLGDSVFNYQDSTVYTFMHYYQQIHHVLKLNPKPKKVLEIGTGDHTVSDHLRRKGNIVKTFDNDENLFPDYIGDVRNELNIHESFDVVLASEVFEHMNIKYLETILKNIKKCLVEEGYLVVSLPYSTVRLFPARNKYTIAYFISCEGRLHTFVPYRYFQPIYTSFRGLYRIIVKKYSLKEAFEPFRIPEYPDDRFDAHHWDLGYRGTGRKKVRQIMTRHFKLVEEKIYYETNCVFYILQKHV